MNLLPTALSLITQGHGIITAMPHQLFNNNIMKEFSRTAASYVLRRESQSGAVPFND
jgi:hypothetical protein